MSFRFPYTNYHELNLDWILEQITSLSELEEQFQALYDELKADFDTINETIAAHYAELTAADATLQSAIDALEVQVEDGLADLKDYTDSLVSTTASELTEDYTSLIETLTTKVESYYITLNTYIESVLEAAKAYTDEKLEDGLSNISVTNYFTGERVTIQEMLNYLSQLHVSESAKYENIISDEITYEDMQQYTYEFLIRYGTHGSTETSVEGSYTYDTTTESIILEFTS